MSWEDDDTKPLPERARSLLDAEGGRGLIKRLGKWLDAEEQQELRLAVLKEGRLRGALLPEEADQWPGKKLLRIGRSHQDAARVRKNPIARDEAFDCVNCHKAVPSHGRTARDHCPHCLFSLHVDVVPGDRADGCGGLLEPIGIEMRGVDTVIVFRCRKCSAKRKVRALRDGDPPDDWSVVTAIAKGKGP